MEKSNNSELSRGGSEGGSAAAGSSSNTQLTRTVSSTSNQLVQVPDKSSNNAQLVSADNVLHAKRDIARSMLEQSQVNRVSRLIQPNTTPEQSWAAEIRRIIQPGITPGQLGSRAKELGLFGLTDSFDMRLFKDAPYIHTNIAKDTISNDLYVELRGIGSKVYSAGSSVSYKLW